MPSEEYLKRKREYIKKWNSTKPKISLEFNYKTEPELCEWMKKQEKAPYIKRLIREDIAKKRAA